MGPKKAEPLGDHGGSRKPASPPPKRSSAPSPGPRLAIAIQPAPPARAKLGGCPHKAGNRGAETREKQAPQALRPFPAAPAGDHPSDCGPGGAHPLRPRPEDEAGSWEERATRICLGGAGSREAVTTARGLKLATARPWRPRLGDAPREGGAAGPGWSAAHELAVGATRANRGLTEHRTRVRSRGPLGPGGGGGARSLGGGGGGGCGPGSVARRRGWAPGGGESEARPAS